MSVNLQKIDLQNVITTLGIMSFLVTIQVQVSSNQATSATQQATLSEVTEKVSVLKAEMVSREVVDLKLQNIEQKQESTISEIRELKEMIERMRR
ncbi:hypothetical protein V6R21_30530 [Limibacter armeniacum]|uniref:hypothetical protein n=1 Tax=Limibacter armeniacum TaxID=466084 RepID=UPI002FE50D9B